MGAEHQHPGQPDAKLYEGLESINASQGLSRDNTAQMAYNAVQAYEVTYNNLQGDYAGVLQTTRLDTMLTRRFQVVKVTGILEANDKLSVSGTYRTWNANTNQWVYSGNGLYSVALEGKSLLNVTNVAGKETIDYSSLYNAQTFTVDTSDEMVGQEIVLYVRFNNELAPNAASSTVIGSPIITENNTVVETSARLKDASAVRSALREGGMTNIGNPTAFLYTENAVQAGVASGITDTIAATLRPDVANAAYNERSAGIFQRFIDNDGNGEPDYIVQIVPVLTSVNSISTNGEDYTFTGINGTISVADIVTDETLARNDVVLVNRYADDCYYVSYPETVEGTVTAFNTNNNTVTVDGASYGNSGGKMLGVSGVDQFLTEEETIDGTFIFYLDPVGNVLGYKETAAVIGNYAIVKGFDRTGNSQMGYSATVKLLMQDSTTATYNLNLAASAVNLGLAKASDSTTDKEKAITTNNPGYVGNPANYNATNPNSDGYKLINHLFSYTLDNGTVTLGYASEINDNYYVSTLANTVKIAKNTAEYPTGDGSKIVANDQTVFFVKDATGDIFVVTGLSKLPANELTITGGETVAYVAPGTSTRIAKAVFVTTTEVYKAARDYVYVTDKYVRTNTSGTPVYSFTVVYPDGTTGTMETKSNVNTIKNKVCEYDYDGSYVNFYPDETSMYNKYYVKSVANNTVTLGNIDTGATVASLRIATGAAIWDVQDDPAADSLAENDVVSLITDTEGAVKAAFIYDVMNGKFVDNPLDPNSSASITVNTTKLTAEGQHVSTSTLNKDEKITVSVTVPTSMNAPVLTINDNTSVTMTRPSAAALVAATTTTYTYEYVYTVTADDAARGYVTFSVKLSQSGLDPLTLTWSVGTKNPDDGTVTPPAEGEYTITVTVDGTTDTTLTKNVKEGEAYSATYTAPEGKIISSVSANGTIATDKKSVALSIASVTKAETIAITLADEGTGEPSVTGAIPGITEVKAGATATDVPTVSVNYNTKENGATTSTTFENWIIGQLKNNADFKALVSTTPYMLDGTDVLDTDLKKIAELNATEVFKVSLDGTAQGYAKSGNAVELTGYTAGSTVIEGKAPTTASSATISNNIVTGKTEVTSVTTDLDLWTAYNLNLGTGSNAITITAYEVDGKKTDNQTITAATNYAIPGTKVWVKAAATAAGEQLMLYVGDTAVTTKPVASTGSSSYASEFTDAITLDTTKLDKDSKFTITAKQVVQLNIDNKDYGYVPFDGTDTVTLTADAMSAVRNKNFIQLTSSSAASDTAITATISNGSVTMSAVTPGDAIDGVIYLKEAVEINFTGITGLATSAAVTVKYNNGNADSIGSSSLSGKYYFAVGATITINGETPIAATNDGKIFTLTKDGATAAETPDEDAVASNYNGGTGAVAAKTVYTIKDSTALTVAFAVPKT